jgi:plasmid stabilization system protein ParE
MIASVSREAELELTDAAAYYAENGGAPVGLALIDEFEMAVDLICRQPQLGAVWRGRLAYRYAVFHSASFTTQPGSLSA